MSCVIELVARYGLFRFSINCRQSNSHMGSCHIGGIHLLRFLEYIKWLCCKLQLRKRIRR